jgi:hypothetical protein
MAGELSFHLMGFVLSHYRPISGALSDGTSVFSMESGLELEDGTKSSIFGTPPQIIQPPLSGMEAHVETSSTHSGD